MIWFPIPIVRNVPLAMARQLGNLAADMKWFPVAYTIVAFGVVPLALLGLSLVHWGLLLAVGLPCLLAFLGLLTVLTLRNTRPERLPARLRNDPKWLPPSL